LYEDRKLLRTTQFRTPYHAVPRISIFEEAACLRTYALGQGRAARMRPAKEKYAVRGEVTILNGVWPAKRVLI